VQKTRCAGGQFVLPTLRTGFAYNDVREEYSAFFRAKAIITDGSGRASTTEWMLVVIVTYLDLCDSFCKKYLQVSGER